MKALVVVGVAACALGLAFALSADLKSDCPLTEVTIRVTSATQGQEVQVQGAYVLTPGSNVHQVSRTTPFEVKEHAERLIGIFGTATGSSPIHVEMVSEGKHSGHGVATATGKAVTVNTNEVEGSSAIAGL